MQQPTLDTFVRPWADNGGQNTLVFVKIGDTSATQGQLINLAVILWRDDLILCTHYRYFFPEMSMAKALRCHR